MSTRPRIFMVAGEPSADQHAAMLGEALLRERDVRLGGVGQSRMRAAGFDLFLDSSGWSGIGVVDSLRRVPRLLGRMRVLAAHLTAEPPDLLVPIDFGAFNARLLRRIGDQLPCPVLYYFPPRSWSRTADYARLAGLVDRVATPFPWSEGRLHEAGIDAAWVGHPVVDRIRPLEGAERASLRTELGLDPARPLVGLLPGSRGMEIRCNGPQMLGAAQMIADEIDEAQFLLSVAPSVPEEVLREQVRQHGLADRTALIAGVPEIVQAADMAIVSSGTATLEAAAAGCPMLVVYRGTRLMSLEKHLRRFSVGFVGIPNILANEEIAPELLDADAKAPVIARHALALLTDEAALAGKREQLLGLREQLGSPGVSERVARMALDMIDG